MAAKTKETTIRNLVGTALETLAEACGTAACVCVTLAAKIDPEGWDVRETAPRKIGFATTPDLAVACTKATIDEGR